jgi:hypothetical protein
LVDDENAEAVKFTYAIVRVSSSAFARPLSEGATGAVSAPIGTPGRR